MISIILLLLLLIPQQRIPGIYRNDRIAYKLTFFKDGTFQNGTKGYPGFCEWGGCHTENGTYRVSGDSVYMYLTSVDDMVAVNDDYGRGIIREDSLHIYFYDPNNGPYSYAFETPLLEAQEGEISRFMPIWK